MQAQTADIVGIGEFIEKPTGTKYLDCEAGTNNAVTHSSKTTKTNVEFIWKAPTELVGTISFMYGIIIKI